MRLIKYLLLILITSECLSAFAETIILKVPPKSKPYNVLASAHNNYYSEYSATPNLMTTEQSKFTANYFKLLTDENINSTLKNTIINNNQVIINSYNQNHQYITQGYYENKAVLFLLDSGASVVTMSENIAKSLNINYSQGKPAVVDTLSGRISARHIIAKNITIGNISLDNVDVAITNGKTNNGLIILGQSFLSKLRFTQDNNQVIIEPIKAR